MAAFFGDGFDLYSTITDCGTYWDAAFGSSVSMALSSTGRFAGSRGLTPSGSSSSNTVAYITKTSSINDVVHHVSLAIQQTTALTGTSNGFWFTLYDGASAQCSVAFRSDGALLLQSGVANGATLATYTGAVAATNTWYQFEIEILISPTAGYMNVRKNGNTSNDFASATNLNTRAGSANSYANKNGVGFGVTSGVTQLLDDFLWRSDASSVAWLGDIRCFTRMPAADSSVAWSRSSTTINYSPYSGSTTAQGSAGNTARYTSFTHQGGTIGTVTLNTSAGGTVNVKCAIFADASGQPGAVIQSATAPISNPTLGANTFTFSPAVAIAPGTKFWVGVCPDAGVASLFGIASSGSSGFSSSAVAYSAFPSSNPGSLIAVAPTNFVPTVTAVANANWVAEQQQDGATSYVYSSTVSQSDLYTIAPISTTPASTVAVVTRGYLQKSDAGTRAAAVQLQSGASNVQATPLALPAGSWAWNWRTDTVDPATSAAWTATAVNNCAIGAIVTT